MQSLSRFPYLAYSAACAAALFLFLAAPPVHASNGKLLTKYDALRGQLENSQYGIPIDIQSADDKKRPHGEVYGVIHHPFQKVRKALTTPANWCSIVPQHLNIKACTYQHLNGQCRLNLYSGRKYYEEPQNSHRIDYTYQVTSSHSDYFQTELIARDGPLGTSDYRILAEAIPLDASSSFIHFSYTFRQGFWARLATSGYLATSGSDKIGFSMESTDNKGKPEYINGIRGILERNAVRYYFAIQSFLDTQDVPQTNRFLSRITTWFQLTEKYPQQLRELGKKEYLSSKFKEHDNQARLQKQIGLHSSKCDGMDTSTLSAAN